MIRDWEAPVLHPRERRIVRALAEALYASASDGPPLADAVDAVEVWLATPHASLRLGLRGLLLGLEASPIRFGFGACAMSGLTLVARIRYLERLDTASSPALSAWKAILGMAYFGQPSSAAAMDLHGRATRLAQILRFPRRGSRRQVVAS